MRDERREKAPQILLGNFVSLLPVTACLGVFIMGDYSMVEVLGCDMLSFHHETGYRTDLLSQKSAKGWFFCVGSA